ncbi:hypothetical protein CNYM01_05911 [Colletotrichum nymphaeae SA-01]|uniref:Uncharacterized protein n=1 Tax=Colletotrichum nymphaeae SA-01 TaxID=1460502 RepID=A0A135TND7_9PEZI|nr:hypothetical protein CNYM01_05911 [Colletotrichum nymphaeae SA-01]
MRHACPPAAPHTETAAKQHLVLQEHHWVEGRRERRLGRHLKSPPEAPGADVRLNLKAQAPNLESRLAMIDAIVAIATATSRVIIHRHTPCQIEPLTIFANTCAIHIILAVVGLGHAESRWLRHRSIVVA